jgi:hypothetical protein
MRASFLHLHPEEAASLAIYCNSEIAHVAVSKERMKKII